MKKSIITLILLSGLFISCSDDGGSAPFIVRLTDSPGDYEKVNIDLESVQIHASTGNQDSGWTTLESNPGIYDLLTLTNGAETVIANDTYPSGRVSQLRLVLGENNTVVIDGVEHALNVPSGSESGLKILINSDLTEGIAYSVLVDFDAAKSVVATGSGKYNLKPVIKAITEALDGGVSGKIFPAELNVAVYAIADEDTLSTSYAVEGNSDYFLGGLTEGSYTISFDPGDLSGYQGFSIDNVDVNLGEILVLDDVTLEE